MSAHLLIDYPFPLTFDGGLVVCIEVEVRVEIEPDEMTGDTDYWISSVEISGRRMDKGRVVDGKPEWHTVPDSDPMSEVIRTYCYRTHERQLQEKFAEMQADRPRRRTRRVPSFRTRCV